MEMLIDLESLRAHIETLAAEKGLLVLPAIAHADSEVPLIDYSPAIASTPPEAQVVHFLELAAKLRPAALILETLKLTDAALEEALAEIDDAVQAHDDKLVPFGELKRLRKDVEACRQHVGKTDMLTLKFPVPGTTFFYALSFFQDWNELIYETSVLLEGGVEIESSSLSKHHKQRLIEAVAEHEDFTPASGSNAELDAVMAEVAEKQGVKIPDYVWSEIRAAAKAHYNAKVRPELQRKMVMRAKEMLAAGKTRAEVAEELGVGLALLTRWLRAR
jgi:transposase